MPTYYAPGNYEQHLTPGGRARTIAAFHIAQGGADKLSTSEMRIDVLQKLMSPSAVRWWRGKEWLELSRTIGQVQMLRLTGMGLQTCSNSLSGLANVNTDADSVSNKRRLMTKGGPGHTKVAFPDLPHEAYIS